MHGARGHLAYASFALFHFFNRPKIAKNGLKIGVIGFIDLIRHFAVVLSSVHRILTPLRLQRHLGMIALIKHDPIH